MPSYVIELSVTAFAGLMSFTAGTLALKPFESDANTLQLPMSAFCQVPDQNMVGIADLNGQTYAEIIDGTGHTVMMSFDDLQKRFLTTDSSMQSAQYEVCFDANNKEEAFLKSSLGYFIEQGVVEAAKQTGHPGRCRDPGTNGMGQDGRDIAQNQIDRQRFALNGTHSPA